MILEFPLETLLIKCRQLQLESKGIEYDKLYSDRGLEAVLMSNQETNIRSIKTLLSILDDMEKLIPKVRETFKE